MTIRVVGLDTAKHVFQVHGADASGKTVLRKRLRRNQVEEFFRATPACVVGMEATRGAHHWAPVATNNDLEGFPNVAIRIYECC